MAPTASTSAPKSSAVARLTPTESKLNKIGLQAPNHTISLMQLLKEAGLTVSPAVQEAINSLLRKNLCSMFKTPTGELSYKFHGKDEAKILGSMDSEEKLVLDRIKDSANEGIWTKDLTSRTGLLRTTITKCLKALEQKKAIKSVKSVKHPTRKIYMLAGVTPSVDITGGPWFTDNELDVEFVEVLKKVIKKFLMDKLPTPSKPHLLLPTSQTPYLPTVIDIRKYISKVVESVELQDEHVESLLDLMVFEGEVEKIMISGVMRSVDNPPPKKRVADSSDEGASTKRPKKKQKKTTTKPVKKPAKKSTSKRFKLAGGANTDSESSEAESDFDSDEDATTAKLKKKKKKKKKGVKAEDGSDDDSSASEEEGSSKRRRKKRSLKKPKKPSTSSSASDPDSDTSVSSAAGSSPPPLPADLPSINDYVYRLVLEVPAKVGWTDMPCGVCPSEAFCTEASKPVPVFLGWKRKKEGRGAGGMGMQGVGMIGGAGAAIGNLGERWGEVRGAIGGGVAPVNPRDCAYFREWLEF